MFTLPGDPSRHFMRLSQEHFIHSQCSIVPNFLIEIKVKNHELIVTRKQLSFKSKKIEESVFPVLPSLAIMNCTGSSFLFSRDLKFISRESKLLSNPTIFLVSDTNIDEAENIAIEMFDYAKLERIISWEQLSDGCHNYLRNKQLKIQDGSDNTFTLNDVIRCNEDYSRIICSDELKDMLHTDNYGVLSSGVLSVLSFVKRCYTARMITGDPFSGIATEHENIRDIVKRVKENNHEIFVINGLSGSGKSNTLMQIGRRLIKERIVLYISMKDILSILDSSYNNLTLDVLQNTIKLLWHGSNFKQRVAEWALCGKSPRYRLVLLVEGYKNASKAQLDATNKFFKNILESFAKVNVFIALNEKSEKKIQQVFGSRIIYNIDDLNKTSMKNCVINYIRYAEKEPREDLVDSVLNVLYKIKTPYKTPLMCQAIAKLCIEHSVKCETINLKPCIGNCLLHMLPNAFFVFTYIMEAYVDILLLYATKKIKSTTKQVLPKKLYKYFQCLDSDKPNLDRIFFQWCITKSAFEKRQRLSTAFKPILDAFEKSYKTLFDLNTTPSLEEFYPFTDNENEIIDYLIAKFTLDIITRNDGGFMQKEACKILITRLLEVTKERNLTYCGILEYFNSMNSFEMFQIAYMSSRVPANFNNVLLAVKKAGFEFIYSHLIKALKKCKLSREHNE